MAFFVLVVDCSNHSIQDLNERVQSPTKPHSALELISNYISGINSGAYDASIQVTTRDTDPSVATSGTGSSQATYNLK